MVFFTQKANEPETQFLTNKYKAQNPPQKIGKKKTKHFGSNYTELTKTFDSNSKCFTEKKYIYTKFAKKNCAISTSMNLTYKIDLLSLEKFAYYHLVIIGL